MSNNLTIEIAIQCYNFQQRLIWMLSSILQQIGDQPNLIISIAYLPNNGNPTTESIINFFKKQKEGIVSGASPGTTDGMKYRSMIVNIFGTEIM